MDWIKEMRLAMLSIQTACKKNDAWNECCNCPFDSYCLCIASEFGKYPDEWEIKIESKH